MCISLVARSISGKPVLDKLWLCFLWRANNYLARKHRRASKPPKTVRETATPGVTTLPAGNSQTTVKRTGLTDSRKSGTADSAVPPLIGAMRSSVVIEGLSTHKTLNRRLRSHSPAANSLPSKTLAPSSLLLPMSSLTSSLGTVNSVKPQSRHTRSSGNNKTIGFRSPSSPGK